MDAAEYAYRGGFRLGPIDVELTPGGDRPRRARLRRGVLGTLVPSYAVAAAAAVAHYLVTWLLPNCSVFDTVRFTGLTALIGQAVRLAGRALLVLALWQGATLCAALAAAWCTAARPARADV